MNNMDCHEAYLNEVVEYVYTNEKSKILEICNVELLLAIIHREKSL